MGERKAKWQNDYIARTYDRINLTVPKGRKEEIQAEAERRGQSVNGFINGLIDEALQASASVPGAGAVPAGAAGAGSPDERGTQGGGVLVFSEGGQEENVSSRFATQSAPDSQTAPSPSTDSSTLDKDRPYLPIQPWEDDSTPELEAKILAVLRKRGIAVPTVQQYKAMVPIDQIQTKARLLSEREKARQALDAWERRRKEMA